MNEVQFLGLIKNECSKKIIDNRIIEKILFNWKKYEAPELIFEDIEIDKYISKYVDNEIEDFKHSVYGQYYFTHINDMGIPLSILFKKIKTCLYFLKRHLIIEKETIENFSIYKCTTDCPILEGYEGVIVNTKLKIKLKK